MTTENEHHDERHHEHDEKPEAGFELNLPFFKAWGGPEQFKLLWPTLRWIVIAIAAVWVVVSLLEAWK